MNKRPVLLVDDDENDCLLMQAAFEASPFHSPIRTLSDGQEAINFLDQATRPAPSAPLPTIILLDLNMPRKNGFEVLSWARQVPQLKGIPFIILSASSRRQDVEKAYELGASAFLVKPSTLDDLTRMLQSVLDWMRINHFPPGNPWVRTG